MGAGTHDGRGRPIRVAVVDGLRLIADAIGVQLSDKSNGIRSVLSACSWAELLAHEEFPADVTVFDLNLNDGIPTDTKVRTLVAAGSRVVVMSRHAHRYTVDRALRAGALAFVPKAARPQELVAAVHAAARGHRYTSEGANAATPMPKDPLLGEREMKAIELYATGMSIKEVAIDMGTTEETVKSYVKRARRKYRNVGIDLGTKIRLRRYALHAGWLDYE